MACGVASYILVYYSIDMRIPQSGSQAPDKGDSSNHGLLDPYLECSIYYIP